MDIANNSYFILSNYNRSQTTIPPTPMQLKIDADINLKLSNLEHAEKLYGIIDRNRSHLSEYLPWVSNMHSLEDYKTFLQNAEQLFKEEKGIGFTIFYQENPVGNIGLYHINPSNKTASIGYWLDENVVGKGIVIKSCAKLIDYGFQDLKLNRIEIKAAVNNHRSQAIPKRLNFKMEGILREAEFVNSSFLDLYLFSLLKNEWFSSKKPISIFPSHTKTHTPNT